MPIPCGRGFGSKKDVRYPDPAGKHAGEFQCLCHNEWAAEGRLRASQLARVHPDPASTGDGRERLRVSRNMVVPAILHVRPSFSYSAVIKADAFETSYRLQPNAQTFSHQLGLWTSLFLSYCKFYRIFTIDVTAEDGGSRLGSLFWNQGIRSKAQRYTAPGMVLIDRANFVGRLQPSAIKQLVNHLLKEGLVAPDPPKQSPTAATYLIYWRKPQEWAKLLLQYVEDNGLKGSIMTVYEITDGDMTGTSAVDFCASCSLTDSSPTTVSPRLPRTSTLSATTGARHTRQAG